MTDSPCVPVAISATFWKASRNEPITMMVVLINREIKAHRLHFIAASIVLEM